MFASGIGPIEDYLRQKHNATDDELKYLQQILELRSKRREPTGRSSDYVSPSIVLDDFLYHGDLGHASNMGLLNSLGIRHIIDICDCPLDSAIVEKFNVLWINLDDVMEANIKKYFEQTNQFLSECKRKNEKVLVHCQMGISRSSSIVLAYLMKYHHDSLSKAYDYLLERRRMASPNYSFFLQLIRYEKELRAANVIDESRYPGDQKNPISKIETS